MSLPKETPELFPGLGSPSKDRHIYSVSQITQDIKILIENTLSQVWVEGEISNFRPSSSGHLYFSLKDENAVLQTVIFSRISKEIKFKPEDGMKVICFGRVEVYPPHGKYQLIVEKLEPKGIGSLQLALEQLKIKLEKEGLFSGEHKKPIPYLPERIGVVTSITGAAIKDILKVLDRRFKDTHIIIYPVKVQGEGAKEEIARAISDFNKLNNVDVLIVGRGGGSIEDLWAFNEELVCRQIYASRIPVISAVGHERDWTIADLVADLRAPTPSAAAELVIPEKEVLSLKVEELTSDLMAALQGIAAGYAENLANLGHRLYLNAFHIHELTKGRLETLAKKLALLNPGLLIQQHLNRIADLARQIYVRTSHFCRLREAEFSTLAEKLSSLSPLNILARGYSITFRLPEETLVKEAATLKPEDTIRTRLGKGEVISRVTKIIDS